MKKQDSKKIEILTISIPTILIALFLSPRIKLYFLNNLLPNFNEGTNKAGFVHATATFITLCLIFFIMWILTICFKKLYDKLIKK